MQLVRRACLAAATLISIIKLFLFTEGHSKYTASSKMFHTEEMKHSKKVMLVLIRICNGQTKLEKGMHSQPMNCWRHMGRGPLLTQRQCYITHSCVCKGSCVSVPPCSSTLSSVNANATTQLGFSTALIRCGHCRRQPWLHCNCSLDPSSAS